MDGFSYTCKVVQPSLLSNFIMFYPSPKWLSIPVRQSLPISLLPALETTAILLVSMDSPILYKWNPASCGLCLRLLSVSMFLIHAAVRISASLSTAKQYSIVWNCVPPFNVDGQLFVSTFRLLCIMQLWRFMYKLSCGGLFSLPLGICPREWLSHVVTWFNILENC